MNICLVSHELYPFDKAGIGVYFYNLALTLTKKDHTVYIITEKRNAAYDVFLKNNIEIIEIEKKSYNSDEQTMWNFSVKIFIKIIELAQKGKIDIIEFPDFNAQGLFSILLKATYPNKLLQGIPIVMKLHTPTYECREFNYNDELEVLLSKMEDWTIRNVDYLYGISNAMSSKVGERLSIDNIPVLPNMTGIVPLKSQNRAIEKIILYVGRLEHRKGVDILIRAFQNSIAISKGYKLILIGNDSLDVNKISYKDYLIGLIDEEYTEKILFINPLRREKLFDYYAKAYVSVFPSRWEGFGNVCVEAMSNGSPVIVSDQGGMNEIVNGGKYGMVFKSGNHEDLALSINEIISDSKKRTFFSESAIQRSEEYTNESLVNRQIEFYHNVIDKEKKRNYDFQVLNLVENLEVINEFFNELINNNHIQVLEEYRYKLTSEHKKIDLLYKELHAYKAELSRVLIEWEKIGKSNITLSSQLEIMDLKFNELSEENEFIRRLNEELVEKNMSLNEFNDELSEKDKRLIESNKRLTEKDKYLIELNKELVEENKRLNESNEELIEKNKNIIEDNNQLCNSIRLISDHLTYQKEDNLVNLEKIYEHENNIGSIKWLMRRIVKLIVGKIRKK